MIPPAMRDSVLSAPLRERSPTPEVRGAPPRWVYAFLITQFLCQLALLVPAFGPLRVVLRTLAFATSLGLFALLPGRSKCDGLTRTLVLVVLGILALSVLNPEGGGPIAAVAQWTFHLAIMAPIFWAGRIAVDRKVIERTLLILWGFYSASAFAGVLQAIFPGRFQPPLSTVLAERGPEYVAAMSIRLASGDWIVRPMGLTDLPGGAAYGGFYAALLGLGVTLTKPFPGARLLGPFSVGLGMICLYLAQVRSLLVMLAICVVALLTVLMIAGRVGRSVLVATVACVVALVTYSLARSLGGTSMVERLSTLTADSAGSVYYRNRGIFLEHTFVELLPQYPLGAGLGRWGMMNNYFGDATRSLWAEIQWTGWLFDGGLLMLLIYPAALLRALYVAVRSAASRDRGGFGVWAALIAAYDVGAVALTFSYPIFMSTAGIEFWLLNALLQAAAFQRFSNPASAAAS
jgi:hypothetical protein